MAFNYFIAYDLNFPGQNYVAVTERIKSLGKHAHMQLSLFYLQSDLALAEVHASIREVMDANDKLAVIWANDAFVSNYHPTNLALLSHHFTRPCTQINAPFTMVPTAPFARREPSRLDAPPISSDRLGREENPTATYDASIERA